ncbi:MAG TPA: thioesterase family protein [Acidimicrobiales bacterium]|nr:thioesterase family protein [Acidimicrobiales bacterium]
MGDLQQDTEVELVGEDPDGSRRFSAKLSPEWEIWGPMGGYVASVALRAAAGSSPFARPASFFCQYLGVAAFDAVDIAVTPLRVAKTALAQRVQVRQGDRDILEATVWSVGEVDGLAHDVTEPTRPPVPSPNECADLTELLSEEDLASGPPFPFWRNLDLRPIDWTADRSAVGDPVWREWLRFAPTPIFADPWVDACRSLILIDLQSWPSASRAHTRGHAFIAPSLDLYVAFHDPRPDGEWLLADGFAPIARDGLMAWNGRLWSEDGALVASGAGQMLCRRVRQA